MMFQAVNQNDWMLLLCSRSSLSRPGVRNEIEEAFRRIARLGGSNRIVPLALDDYVFGDIDTEAPELATRLRDLVIKDLGKAMRRTGDFMQFARTLVDDLTSSSL